PGWYAHVFQHATGAAMVWAARAARLLREQDIDASSANVIETVRLAEALASLRELPMPGLLEMREAIHAELAGGEMARLALIRSKLEVGDALGTVPENAGQVPLVADFEREAKRLRLKLTPEQVVLDLDLRKDLDREKSELIRRVGLLDIPWGR